MDQGTSSRVIIVTSNIPYEVWGIICNERQQPLGGGTSLDMYTTCLDT